VPWVDDVHRYASQGRAEFFEACKRALDDHQRPYTIISGGWEERFEKALRSVSEYLD
jgi:nicotinamide riboside kinase